MVSLNKNMKNFSYMFIVQIANYLFPLITLPIVSRIFGPEKIGLIAYITAIVGYFVLLVDYSFSFSGVRRLSREHTKRDEIFNTILTVRFFLFLLSGIVFVFCVFFLPDLYNNFYLSLVIFLTCLVPLFSNIWFLQAQNNFKVIAIFSFIAKLFSTILILLLVRNINDILIYTVILSLSSVIISVATFIYIVNKYKINVRIQSGRNCIQYLKDDKYLFLSTVVTNLYTTTGVVVLGVLASKSDVGIYSSAQRLIDLLKSLIMMPIYQIIFPLLSKKFVSNLEDGLNSVRIFLPVFTLMVIVVLLGILLFGKIIILLLFGSAFSDSYLILVILGLGLAAVFYGMLIGGQIMLNLGMDREFVRIQVIVSVLSLFLNIIILPYGGGVTTAIIWSLSEVIITLYQILVLKSKGIKVFSMNMLSLNSIKLSLKSIMRNQDEF
ncbi:oligosaccharide flippase family protein [Acinetobacter baumannii]|nr:oligosaccharide flippase family protein [Acinetobacter baumannii]MCG6633635.1 oligosaccharide flippase family protein [Acinetobacter baumannii]MCJ9136787.1 oligosaccharide flippase family protein [Acinetobacter baumannii]MCJ9279556.1 oligosaccharide flippase family protein [Acinetobacter baumannii]MCJ9451058.1 oligosaccharide flippase family protein [Acinetobacter baumannii]MCJ9484123.1 oligosaccharide flippase family protein [Acinetobacter baumannii]